MGEERRAPPWGPHKCHNAHRWRWRPDEAQSIGADCAFFVRAVNPFKKVAVSNVRSVSLLLFAYEMNIWFSGSPPASPDMGIPGGNRRDGSGQESLLNCLRQRGR